VAATITAMRDLHIDNRSLAGNLTGIINQRLIRRLCLDCQTRVPIADPQRRTFVDLHLAVPEEVFTALGCEACRRTGYHGRIGVFETALATSDVSAAIAAGATEAKLRELVRAAGTNSLTHDALIKAGRGLTSVDEAVTMRWM
jgi:type II secretory ATPase GspE/PulE/Tfp pilus assembly ATPase PilB-like protein